MRIGLDGLPLVELKTGVGHYTFELARALAAISPMDEYELVSPYPFASQTRTIAAASNELDAPSNLRLIYQQARRFDRHWWTVGLPRYIKREGLQLFHGTNYDVPLWRRCPSVVTIHDLSQLLHAGTHEARSVRRARRRLPLVARLATMIVTHTESVRREICEHFNVPSTKIVAIPAAPRRIFRPATPPHIAAVKERFNIAEEFVLFVGTIEPRKNLKTLVCAFAQAARVFEERASHDGLPQLVIAGKVGWLSDELFAHVKGSSVEARLRFIGYVTDEDLRALYSACRVFVYPSLYEGFGLPPLEAMACGAPVIASRIRSITEAVGTTAARLVAPQDVEALAQSLIQLLDDENARARLSALGIKRAAEFTWERTAHRMREVYTEACARYHKA